MKKLKIALSGIGNRALPKKRESSNWLGWVELIKRSEYFELAAAHDTSEDSIKRIIAGGYLKPEATYRDLDAMLKKVDCDAILIANPAEFHAVTIKKALERNLDILVEKPFVNKLDEGKELVGRIDKSSRIVAVVQNWRYKDAGRIAHDAIRGGIPGKVGYIFFRYVRNRENPSYPAYIFDEKYPLLYAMGIHHLDLFRYMLNDEYISVSGHSFKPPWSLYESDTGLDLFLKTKLGVSIMYSGTISSANSAICQESLVVEGEKGTLLNESQWCEPPLWFCPAGSREKVDLTKDTKDASIAGQYNASDIYILNDFYNSIVNKTKPACPAKDAIESVRALEASRLACETGKTILMEKIS